MSTDERIERYLAAATAGLHADRELELEAQAKLRSKIEAQLAAAAKTDEDEAADPVAHVLAGLAPAATVATELAAANGTRMKQRARLRCLGRWVLLPAAVAATLYTIDVSPLVAMETMVFLFGNDTTEIAVTLPVKGTEENNLTESRFYQNLAASRWLPANWFVTGPKFTPDQALILHGDPRRPNRIQQQLAIWEAHPENRIYFHNYITQLLADQASDDQLKTAVAAGRRLDADNARFDYLLADRLLKQAVTLHFKWVGKDTNDRPQYTPNWTIRDRAKLDQAMGLLQAGLAKPEYRRYYRDMLTERLRILGQPQTLVENLDPIALVNGTQLPDVGGLKALAGASVLYADQLVREGHQAEAEPFLNAWRPLVAQLNTDNFTMLDIMKAGTILDLGRHEVPQVWQAMGQPARAEQARRDAARMSLPVTKLWRLRTFADAPPNQILEKSGGTLAIMLLRSLGPVNIAPGDFTMGRQLDYVMAEKVGLCLAALSLLSGLAGCGIVYWRWRLTTANGAAIPLLLLPGWRDALRILGYGTILPLLGYYAYSRWLPWNGRDYNLLMAWPLLLTETILLLLLILSVTAQLVTRMVRRRCCELGLPISHNRGTWWTTMRIIIVLLVVCLSWLMVAQRNGDPVQGGRLLFVLITNLLAATGLGLCALWALVVGLAGRRAFGLYRGSLARTLFAFLALGVIAVSLVGKPYLTVTERELVQCDPLIRIDPETGAFTAVEARLIRQLTAEIRQAAEALPPAPRVETKNRDAR